MNIKNILRSKLLLFFLSFIAIIALAVVIIPPMINLDFLKPKIENIILSQTGIPAKINGNITFRIKDKAQIVAHDITVPNGTISSAVFSVPFFSIFDLQNANISDDIYVDGASLDIEKIIPWTTKNKIIVNNSKFKFLDKEYNIIDAQLSNQNLNAIVRTNQHKYEIKSHNNMFVIKNKNNELNISGELFDNGTVIAHLEINAQNINKWFEFSEPRIKGRFPINADISWDGQYGIKFYNLSANGVTGSIDIKDNGYKIIQLQSKNADFDMTFFLQNPNLLQRISFDLDFYGNLKFADKVFHHLKIITDGSDKEIKINTIVADEIQIHNGTINETGAHNLYITMPKNGIKTTCVFSGTPIEWSCDEFSYGETLSGNIRVDKNNFDINLFSSKNINDMKKIINTAKEFGDKGIINFVFPDMAGIIRIDKDNYDIKYKYAKNKNLLWADMNFSFLPKSMLNEEGDFLWENNSIMFIPKSQAWQFLIKNNMITLRGDNFKTLFDGVDLQSLQDLPFTLTGSYKKNTISNLELDVNNHKFFGTFANKSLTLKTDVLNIDSFISREFINNYEQISFIAAHPLTIPFDLGINIALSANTLIYNNQKYTNFLYSRHNNIQRFSISDANRGNLLATITQENKNYEIYIQLNKFLFTKKLLPENMPLNLSDTNITAEIKLKTSGIIAQDIIDNLMGDFDASFEGGNLYGLGFAEFYAFAPKINLLNGEQKLISALSDGITPIKKMHINGTYTNGDIKTTTPLSLSMRHVDGSGMFELVNNQMFAQLKFILRGTSAGPEPVELTIHQNSREFALSEIMLHFDPEYMRDFVKSHNQF